MEKYRCIIIEDEPLAVEILEDYIRQVPFLEIVKICSDAFYAIEAFQKETIDVIFLDIHLPKLKGIDFLRSITNPPQVIITTAYREYALDGFDFDVADFLLKPFRMERFLRAINKLRLPKKQDIPLHIQEIEKKQYFFINVNKKKIKLYFDDILFVESKKDYVKIMTIHNSSYLTKMQLSEVELMCDSKDFVRVHRSFIVAVQKISAVAASKVEVGKHIIPIGRSYKENIKFLHHP